MGPDGCAGQDDRCSERHDVPAMTETVVDLGHDRIARLPRRRADPRRDGERVIGGQVQSRGVLESNVRLAVERLGLAHAASPVAEVVAAGPGVPIVTTRVGQMAI